MVCLKLFISVFFLKNFYRIFFVLSMWFVCFIMIVGIWWWGILMVWCMCGGMGVIRLLILLSMVMMYDYCLCCLNLKYFLSFYLNNVIMFNVLDWKFFNMVIFIFMFLIFLVWVIFNIVIFIFIINCFILSIFLNLN